MAGWISFALIAAAAVFAIAESRAIPAEPISVMIDQYGNPVVFLREKRTPVNPYPQRAMMFTGYYRPVRRSGGGSQATGVFAQGNAVSGEAFFGPHFRQGPEPIEEQEISSAEAEASPDDESVNETEENGEGQTHVQHPDHHHDHHDHHEHDHRHEPEVHQHHEPEVHQHHEPEVHQHHEPEVHQHHEPEVHHHHDDDDVYHEQEAGHEHEHEHEHKHHHEEPQDYEPESAQPEVPAELPEPATTVATVNRPKVRPAKKPKRPVVEEEDEDEEYEDDEPVVPFVPFNKGNRRRQNYPNLNNFFPMIFSFPGATRRDGSSASGSPPGAVTAIANSYSTGKGGVASSVATAYGGSPNGKKRRNPPQAEE